MAAIFYWGSIVGMIICGGVSVYGISVIIKNWKNSEGNARTKTIGGLAGVIGSGIFCYIVFTIVGIFYEPFPKKETPVQETPQQVDISTGQETRTTEADATYTDAASVKEMSFEEFKTAYNANVKMFSTEPINDWTFSTGEKANTVRHDFEGGAILIFLENIEPYHVQGIFFLFGPSGDPLKTVHATFKLYTLILSVEPEESPENIPNFCLTVLNSEPDRSIKSKSGNTYSIQEIQENLLITIAMRE
jgi:hypothetical protein